jgi:hypothetical protein
MTGLEQWYVEFEGGEILELKGIYYTRATQRDKKKGLASSRRRCETTWHYKIVEWPKGVPISVEYLRNVFVEAVLINGLIEVQDRTVLWDSFRIRSLTRVVLKNSIIRVPLEGITGRANGQCRANRALAIDLYEKFRPAARRFYIRGVSEEYSNIPSTGKPLADDPIWKHAINIELNYTSPIETDKIVLVPGRLENSKTNYGSPTLTEIVSARVLGVVDLPEQNKRSTGGGKRYSGRSLIN